MEKFTPKTEFRIQLSTYHLDKGKSCDVSKLTTVELHQKHKNKTKQNPLQRFLKKLKKVRE